MASGRFMHGICAARYKDVYFWRKWDTVLMRPEQRERLPTVGKKHLKAAIVYWRYRLLGEDLPEGAALHYDTRGNINHVSLAPVRGREFCRFFFDDPRYAMALANLHAALL